MDWEATKGNIPTEELNIGISALQAKVVRAKLMRCQLITSYFRWLNFMEIDSIARINWIQLN